MSSTQQLLLGEGAGGAIPAYIEEVFSTFLYPGNSSTQTITNGIDLSTKGGLVWSKYRTSSFIHNFFDTARGVQKTLCSNTTDAQATETGGITAFNSDGYTTGSWSQINSSSGIFVSWTFREQPKFFDIVTFSTTSGSSVPITVNHNLGSVPGCIIVKPTNISSNWSVYHRSLGAFYVELNSTDMAQNGGTSKWYSTPTSTSFTLGGDFVQNATYVAYVFAHDAGGFGPTGTDNAISCGSFTTSGGAATVTLGYQPQWLMVKRTDSTGDWGMYNIMQGIATGNDKRVLYANTSGGEVNGNDPFFLTATGFTVNNAAALPGGAGTSTYIYIAIRKGPMKVPTSGTSIFTPLTRTGTGALETNGVTGIGFAPDLLFVGQRGGGGFWNASRLTRFQNSDVNFLFTSSTSEQSPVNTGTSGVMLDGTKTGTVTLTAGSNINQSSRLFVDYFMLRAPSFMDVVAYTGTGSATTFSHNLSAVPELMIVKMRNLASDWPCYHKDLGNDYAIYLNGTYAKDGPSNVWWNSTTPTSSVFSVRTNSTVNASGYLYVAYLFATCAGVSKVGSYTGTAATQTIDCGFTSGARFVFIKRTDSTGGWYVWDTARGMVSGTDPSLLFNSSAAENNANWVYTTATGFQIVTTDAGVNASGGTYIFLAIA
jgi:hypothetical protein